MGKARFFAQFGFGLNNGEMLAAALRAHARKSHEVLRRDTPFGPRFELDGLLDTPSGERPRVRSVWQVDDGNASARLITAYLLEVEDDQ